MPTVLALCAHPDDAEFRCGGTLLLLAQRDWQVHIATCSAGDCGSAELGPNAIATLRRAEARDAAACAGGTYHCLHGLDLQIYDNDVMRGAATALIREVNPDCLITHYPIDYMPDHDAASAITRCAAFTASIPNYVVGPASAVPPTAQPVPLYYFGPLGSTDYFGAPVVAPWFVDISAVIDTKADMLSRHASQREWLRRQHGMDQYLEEMKKWDADAARHAGVTYAEGFFQHAGHGYPQTPVLQDALRELVHVRG